MRLYLVLLFLSLTTASVAQESSAPINSIDKSHSKAATRPRIKGYVGFGVGLDHGGIGPKIEVLPLKSLGVFLGAGANFNGIGINTGVSYKFLADKPVRPILTAMYGYNGVIIIKSNYWGTTFKKTFYGLTVGGGGEFQVGKKMMNKFVLQLLVPFRNGEFHELANASGASVLPILFSVGLNLGF